MSQRALVQRGMLFAVALTSLAGCGSLSLQEADKVDYKSAGKVASKPLDVPPDLTQLSRDNRYAIPDVAGSATASTYKQGNATAGMPAAASGSVAPKSTEQMRIERVGNQRYLVIKQSPEALWPQLKEFWQEAGFLIHLEKPEAGVMETDWAENRAKIPQDIIRSTLGKVFDSLYSTGERDKFRTRLERAADGSTEVYISHRGAQEVVTGLQKDSSIWTVRPSDPELEAEFLARLMARLGTDGAKAKETVAKVAAQPQRARLVKADDGQVVELDEEFDRAWRRVGLALDRVGFTVEDRDRTLGLYFVRYIDDAVANAEAQRGFLSRLFTYDGGDKSKAEKYRIAVKTTGQISRVIVLNADGKADNSKTAEKILGLLNDQLK